MPIVMLSAMEVSGDMHGAYLARALRARCPSVRIIGIGGEKMKAAGVQVRLSTAHMGVVGVVEGVRHYRKFLHIRRKTKAILKSERPDLLVLIDSRDFNIGLISTAKKLGIRVAYYVAPPVWAWPDWKMLRLARKLDKIIAIFPFEERIFREKKAPVVWVGHPLVDLARPSLDREDAFAEFGLDPEKPVIGLLPGSREWEIQHLLPAMLESAHSIRKTVDEVQFVVPVADSGFHEMITKMVDAHPLGKDVIVLAEDVNVYDVMNVCTLLITSSGTATLEATCIGTPMVIAYKAHLLTYLLGRLLLRLSHIGLPNILAGREIVPEFLQHSANEDNIARTTVRLLTGGDELSEMKRALSEVRDLLGSPGAVDRAAQALLKIL